MMAYDKEKSLLCFDEGFPDRVLKTSYLLSLIVIACSLSYMSLMLTASIAIGCLISLILYKTTWWTIKYSTMYKRENIKGFFLKVSFLKYFVAGAMLLSACLLLEVNVAALALGLGIVVAVIVLKVGSRLFVNYMNRAVKVSNFKHQITNKFQ
ncbi:MAG TPA: hypothetical protein ACFYEK_03830 [Candidatus Wunengus sp. YC60]|uniref:hypothetical protein n=1 Tax=Candidatus Wunengus sp. YC60 TaxID=3367697 RepID=UPI0040268A06